MMNPDYMGPVKDMLMAASKEIDVSKNCQHWFCGGDRSIGIAVQLIKKYKIIAVPTDTVYGLTCLAQNSDAVQKLYSIKCRDKNKPLAICVSEISEISTYGDISHLPAELLESLLPGPVTIVVNRTDKLNPELNPDTSTIGIRIPQSKFMRNIVKWVGEPLALTSANESNCSSTLHPDEFKSLWPHLDGIFYDNSTKQMLRDKKRLGSTVIDLTEPGCYKIIRPGMASIQTREYLRQFGLVKIKEKTKLKQVQLAA